MPVHWLRQYVAGMLFYFVCGDASCLIPANARFSLLCIAQYYRNIQVSSWACHLQAHVFKQILSEDSPPYGGVSC